MSWLKKIYERELLPIGLLMGTIIGAGFFSLPYVFSQSGAALGFFYLLLGTVSYLVVHLMYADVIVGTPTTHRFPGYANVYLGKGGRALAILASIFGSLLAMTIYLVLSASFGKLITPIAGGGGEVAIFWLLGSLTLFLRLKGLTAVETIITGGIIAIIGVISWLGIGNAHLPSLSESSLKTIGLPLSPAIFSLGGLSAIYLITEYVRQRGGSWQKPLKRVITLGTLIPAVLYAFFILGIIGLSKEVSPDAVSGLISQLHPLLLTSVGILGLLTLWSSYVSVGFNLRDILGVDFNLPEWLRDLIVVGIPFGIYLAGFHDFLTLVSFAGGFLLALEGILAVWMWRRFRARGGVSTLLPRLEPVVVGVVIATFVAAFAHELFS